VAAGAAVIGAGLALSLWRYGLHDHLEYLRVLSYIARRGEVFYANQSINGALNRAWFNGSSLEWHDHEFAPVHLGVYLGTIAGFVLLSAAAFSRPGRGAGTVIDLSMAALAATLAVPLAWNITTDLVADLCSRHAVRHHPPPARTVDGAGAGRELPRLGNYFQFTNHFAGTWLNLLQSYLLGAALCLFGSSTARLMLERRTARASREMPSD